MKWSQFRALAELNADVSALNKLVQRLEHRYAMNGYHKGEFTEQLGLTTRINDNDVDNPWTASYTERGKIVKHLVARARDSLHELDKIMREIMEDDS